MRATRVTSLLLPCLLLPGIASVVVAASTDDPPPAAASGRSIVRHAITSVRLNRRMERFKLTSRQVPGEWPAPWTIGKTTLHGGLQEGVDLISIHNGRMEIVIVPTRGMSILEVKHGDLRLGWNSPVKEVVHPQHIRLGSRGGLGWLEGFNEWMVRCGLEFAGHPGRDRFITNTGDPSEMDLTLHGRIGNLPASEVEILIDQDPPLIRLRAVIHERLFFGPKLSLATELQIVPGADSFRIVDTVTNHGATPQEFELIYHVNFGRPLLGKGSQVVVPAGRVQPMNAHAATGLDQWNRYAGPVPGFIEQVYLIEPLADKDGRTAALLKSASGTQGASIHWPTSELPYFTVWKNTTAEADGYVTGLEPGTCYPFNRRVERKAGRLPVLKPGASSMFHVEYRIHPDAAAVRQAEQQIEAIRGDRQPELVEIPPEIGE